jgi:hypothetical protein
MVFDRRQCIFSDSTEMQVEKLASQPSLLHRLFSRKHTITLLEAPQGHGMQPWRPFGPVEVFASG